MSRILEYPAALANQLRRIAIEAGDMTLDYFEEASLHTEAKADGTPVTLADQKAEEVIQHALKEVTPEIPMIGEETVASGQFTDLSESAYFWLVDPLDGTREFISGSGEYTVNIALIKDGKPMIGVVYAPAKGELYAAHGQNTAIRWLAETGGEKHLHVRTPPQSGLHVVASKSHGSGERLDRYLDRFKISKLIKRGSSLKICAVASGKADLYPRFGPTCEWDTAAAHAVLNGAGGILVDARNAVPLSYGHNRQGKWLNPEFIASGFEENIQE